MIWNQLRRLSGCGRTANMEYLNITALDLNFGQVKWKWNLHKTYDSEKKVHNTYSNFDFLVAHLMYCTLIPTRVKIIYLWGICSYPPSFSIAILCSYPFLHCNFVLFKFMYSEIDLALEDTWWHQRVLDIFPRAPSWILQARGIG